MKYMTDIEKFHKRRKERLRKRGIRFDFAKKSSEYDWITINGQHTPIDDNGLIAGGKFSGEVYSGNKIVRSKKRSASIGGIGVRKKFEPYNKRKFGFCNGTSVGSIAKDATVHPTKYGIDIIQPKKINESRQHISVDRIKGVLDRIPASILKCCPKEIQLLDYRNPRDEYWEKMYGIPEFRSFATGGTDNIAYYENFRAIGEDEIVHTMSHEIGHNIDRRINNMFKRSGEFFSDGKEWTEAIDLDYDGKSYSSTGKWASPYACQSQNIHEDFADSIQQYVMARKEFKERFPHRASIIEEMLKKL